MVNQGETDAEGSVPGVVTQAIEDTRPERRVRSFVRRDGRVTPAQRRAIEALSGRYLVPDDGAPIDAAAVFGRVAPLVVEIGCGNGDNLLSVAATRPDTDFIGIETYVAGIGGMLAGIERLGLTNVRLVDVDAMPVLSERIAPRSIDEIWVFFPDPWPKKRHHKRRLVNPAFLELAASRLAAHGCLRVATDWPDYAAAIDEAATASPFVQLANRGAPGLRPVWRPLTRFESRGLKRGHPVADFLLLPSLSVQAG